MSPASIFASRIICFRDRLALLYTKASQGATGLKLGVSMASPSQMPEGTVVPSGGALPSWLENAMIVPLFSPLGICIRRAAGGGDSEMLACLIKNLPLSL